MNKNITYIHTTNAPQAIGPYSQAVKVNNMVYTSGQIALAPDGIMLDKDISIQTDQVLKNLTQILKEAGCKLDDVIKTTIFLDSMDDFVAVNKIYEEYFGNHKPARSTVAVKTLPKDALVEIEAIAVLP
jgi:2-iminobutanoate/2-iminopropanoate deaminase